MRARRRFLLPHKKYMIGNGFEGIGPALAYALVKTLRERTETLLGG
jgi:hypothetical protein